VPLDYDPMLAKLIVHAPDRAMAIARMRRALDEYFIDGIKTNLPLFRRILEHPDFAAANIDTGFLDRLLAEPSAGKASEDNLPEIAALSAALFAATAMPQKNGRNGGNPARSNDVSTSRWQRTARAEGSRDR
jgi:acetyl-CoA carboxylase biotin carboxylase subunit